MWSSILSYATWKRGTHSKTARDPGENLRPETHDAVLH